MEHADAIRIYDQERDYPTVEGLGRMIRATQWMAKQYRQLAADGLTRPALCRFAEWKHTSYGRRLIAEIGEDRAREVFMAGANWAPPKQDASEGESGQ